METRKLELKDIAGYLPYGLEFAFRDSRKQLGKEFTLNKNGIYYNGIPILRPLSDLYRTITHNGKEITPIVELAKIANLRVKYKTDWIFDDDSYAMQGGDIYFTFEKGGFWSFINGNHKTFGNQIYNQHQLFDFLHEIKIDYRGLIEAGLAIDVNTLDINPYK